MFWLASLMDSVETALLLWILVWVFGWARENLGSDKLAILFALIVVYLTFYQFPGLIWLMVALVAVSAIGIGTALGLNPFREPGLR
ncbi:MAG: hypothetical protein HY917_01880 [Candidatus Diapherotrites archaeon]|nr:hypothetical protein [Candidatus Diapherotrites archaeon]